MTLLHLYGEAQAVQPEKPLPPHWAYRAAVHEPAEVVAAGAALDLRVQVLVPALEVVTAGAALALVTAATVVEEEAEEVEGLTGTALLLLGALGVPGLEEEEPETQVLVLEVLT